MTQEVEVEWTIDNGALHVDVGTCVVRYPNFVHVDYGEMGTYPLPPKSESVQIYRVTVKPFTKLLIKKPRLANRALPEHPELVIYCDGGARPNPGPAGAGIHVFSHHHLDGSVCEQRHGKFYASTSNNAAEFASAIAAMRLILREFSSVDNIVLYTDSELVFKNLTGQCEVKLQALRPLSTTARDLYLLLVQRVTLVHMHREDGNPADLVATTVIATAADLGLADLFPECPTIIPKQHRAPAAPVLIEPTPPPCLQIEDLDDFIKLRDFKTRGTIPPQAYSMWGSIVGRQLGAILTATTTEARDRYIVEFFALPTRYLPARAWATRVIQHLTANRPFRLELNSSRAQRERDGNEKVHRMAEAVHRSAMEFRLRSANKVISNGVEGDLTFDEKVQKLEAKLVPKDEDDVDDAAIDYEEVPCISAKEVQVALRAINRQCATSIDGWTKDLLTAAIKGAPYVAENLGAVLHILLSQRLSPLLSEIMRLARLVGLPKSNGGVRPIAISNVWMKLMGTIALQRDGIKPSRRQYAVGRKDGCLQIIHEIRDELQKLNADIADDQYVVVKFDAQNAFNALRRKHLRACIATHSVTTRQYFRLCYEESSTLAVFGPQEYKKLMMEDGVRQGDSTSSYLFCIGVDGPLEELVRKGYRCWMYCDDLTVIVKRSEAEAAVTVVAEEFAKIGLKINEEKTEIFDPFVPRSEPFIVLGIDLANTTTFFEDKIAKAKVYFDTVDALPLHPQLKTVLLRLCGAPKLIYLLKGMAPQFTETIAETFDDMVLSSLAKAIGVSVNELPLETVHHTSGAGIPSLKNIRADLYNASRNYAIERIQSAVELVPSDPTALSSPSARHNMDASWLWYHDAMTPAEFIAAFCVRLGFLPSHLRIHPIKCHCGTVVTSDAAQIDHTFRCDRFTRFTHATRHNMVRDAMARVAMQYGLSAIVEPSIYTYTAGRKRPDIVFQTSTAIATDITIVMPTDTPGDAACDADERKIKTHTDAVKALGHIFIPAAAEAYGLMGKGFTKLVDALTRDLATPYQWGFSNDMNRAITTAMARSRAAALYGSKQMHDANKIAP